MRGIKLLTMYLLTIFMAACLVGTPAFSGEHPWDNDNQHPGTHGSSGNSSGDGGPDENCHVSTASVQQPSVRPGTQSGVSAGLPVTVQVVVTFGNWFVEHVYGGWGVAPTNQSKQSVKTRRSN